MKYHLHVFGCQMNEADAQRVGSEMEKIGLRAARDPSEADVVVLNTCVVRQSAEDKAHSYIQTLKPIKQEHPDKIITVMGCMVGVRGNAALKRAYPWVDVFMAPSETRPLLDYLRQREAYRLLEEETRQRFAIQDGDMLLPAHEYPERTSTRSARVPGAHETSISSALRARAWIASQRLHPDRLRLLARLHVLHHPVPAGRRTQPACRRDRARGALAGRAGRDGSHAPRPDRGSLRPGRARRP